MRISESHLLTHAQRWSVAGFGASMEHYELNHMNSNSLMKSSLMKSSLGFSAGFRNSVDEYLPSAPLPLHEAHLDRAFDLDHRPPPLVMSDVKTRWCPWHVTHVTPPCRRVIGLQPMRRLATKPEPPLSLFSYKKRSPACPSSLFYLCEETCAMRFCHLLFIFLFAYLSYLNFYIYFQTLDSRPCHSRSVFWSPKQHFTGLVSQCNNLSDDANTNPSRLLSKLPTHDATSSLLVST